MFGAPRTKKNSQEIRRRGGFRVGRCPVCKQLRGTPFITPSKAWKQWVMSAQIQFEDLPPFRVPEPITVPVNCRAVFYRDVKSKGRGDAVGFYQGLADVLEKRCVIRNDELIRTWDGSHLDVDIENPRTEVVLELMEV